MYNNITFDFENESAMEGFFADDEKSTSDLLDLIRVKISEIDSIEKLEEILESIDNEIVEYNKLLNEISAAISDFKAGNISKDDMLAVTTPALAELRENSKALGLLPSDNYGDDDITTEEIAAIKEIIVGSKVIVQERINTIKNHEGSDLAGLGTSVVHSTDSWNW